VGQQDSFDRSRVAPLIRERWLAGLRLRLTKVRFVADDGNAVHDAMRGAVIVRGVVLGAAVVPEGDVTFLPGMADLQLC
jgi:hypothetical protein